MARPRKTPAPVLAADTDALTGDPDPISLPLVRETVEQHPELMAPTSPEVIDRSAMFLTYLAFMGDVQRTSAALMVDPARVREAAEFEGWDARVKHLLSVKSDMGPDEFLRELNRVVNFVQAVRLRSVMDEVLKKVQGPDSSLDDFLTTTTKDTTNRSAKGLLDIIKCCEAVHRMTYTALGDLPGKRSLDQGDSAKGSVALSILGALSQGTSHSSPSQVAVATTPEARSTLPSVVKRFTPKRVQSSPEAV